MSDEGSEGNPDEETPDNVVSFEKKKLEREIDDFEEFILEKTDKLSAFTSIVQNAYFQVFGKDCNMFVDAHESSDDLTLMIFENGIYGEEEGENDDGDETDTD